MATDYFELMQDFTTRHIGATRKPIDPGLAERIAQWQDEDREQARRERIDYELEQRERRDFES